MKYLKFAIISMFFLIPAIALADEPTPTPTPQIVEFQLAPTPTPTMPPVMHWEEEITEHQLDSNEVEILAKLLWSSPLANEDYKRQLLWVVFNRVEDERLGLFGRSVETVVIKSEFAFYDHRAHLSETNLRIVKEELNRWLSSLDGGYVNRPVPRSGLYIRFCGTGNRMLEVTSTPGGEAL